LPSTWFGMRGALVNVGCGGAIKQETERFRPAVVAARVHQLLALVDPCEVDLGDNPGVRWRSIGQQFLLMDNKFQFCRKTEPFGR